MKFQEIYNTINESEGRVLPNLVGVSFSAAEYADLLDICLYWIGVWNEKSFGSDISIKLYHWVMNVLRTRKSERKFTDFTIAQQNKTIAMQIIKVQKLLPEIEKEIRFELNRAIEKHPNYPTNRFEQVCILQEEVGEVTKSVL